MTIPLSQQQRPQTLRELPCGSIVPDFDLRRAKEVHTPCLASRWALAFWALLFACSNAYSLDCSKNNLSIAAIDHICHSPDLLVADDLLNELFNEFRHSPRFTSSDLAEQRSWLKKVRNPCEGSHLCLEAAYSLRLEEIAGELMKTSSSPLVAKEKNKIKIFYNGRYRSGWGDQNRSPQLYKNEKGELYTAVGLEFPQKNDSGSVKAWYSLDSKSWLPADAWRHSWKALKWDYCLDADQAKRLAPDKNLCTDLAWGRVSATQSEDWEKCPLGNKSVSIVIRRQDKLVSYRVILGSAYPIVFENTGCDFESLHLGLPGYLPGYSKRRYYEAESAAVLDLKDDSFLLSVADMLLKYPYDLLTVKYPGVAFIEEQKLQSLKLKLWMNTKFLGNKSGRIKLYEATLDQELGKLFPEKRIGIEGDIHGK